MEKIPLADGDLGWVFPQVDNPAQLLETLSAADAHMRRLAEHLGTRPSWTGSGLEYHRFEHVADLFGCAETDQVSFIAELDACTLSLEPRIVLGPPWEVDAEISVRCDAPVDCGMHVIEELPESRCDSPMEAARRLAAAARWLYERGTAEPPGSWRRRDARSGHG